VAETVNTNQFKNGMHIELEGSFWRIVEFQHVKPGKGGAFVRTKLKGLDTGAVVDKTFRAGEKFPRVRTETKDMQYLYDSGDEVVFMDTDTYEQTALPHAAVEDALEFMLPSSTVQMLLVNGAPTGVQLPASVDDGVGDGARREGRHGLERDEAGDARDGRRRAGPALREHGRPHQGRAAREALHLSGLAQRSSQRVGAVLEHGLAVRHDDELHRKSAETLAQLRPELPLNPLLLAFREPAHR